MRRALELARAGWGQTSPNPMVGAVVVRDGAIVGEGAHRQFGGPHAEVEALSAAGSRARGATLYVTLEPCVHQGKTPPCVTAIVAAGIRRVVVAMRDRNPEAAGGLERLRTAGLSVDAGPGAEAALELNAAYFHSYAAQRPWTTLKLAVSLDGAIADYTREPGWMTGEAARQAVHRLRAGHDVIAVGMGTVLTDDPQLTVRDAPLPRVPPLRAVFSRTGRLPLTSRLAQSVHEAPVLVFAQSIDPAYEQLLRQLGVEVVLVPLLDDAMRLLVSRGHRALLVEGGARLGASLMEAKLVDRLVVFQAPLILGAGAVNAFAAIPSRRVGEAPRLRIVTREPLGDDLMTVFALDRS